jgi:hypothetical protein
VPGHSSVEYTQHISYISIANHNANSSAVLRCLTLYYIVLRCITLRYVALRCIKLCYDVLCCLMLCYAFSCCGVTEQADASTAPLGDQDRAVTGRACILQGCHRDATGVLQGGVTEMLQGCYSSVAVVL